MGKKPLIYPQKLSISYNISSHAASIYSYIKQHVICCEDNHEQLVGRINEVYFELLDSNSWQAENNSVLVLPTVQQVAEIIDEENMSAIDTCCNEAGLSVEETDHIMAIYCHEIACVLDSWVNETLWAIGLPLRYRSSPQEKVRFVFGQEFHPDQIKFDFWEVWERGCV